MPHVNHHRCPGVRRHREEIGLEGQQQAPTPRGSVINPMMLVIWFLFTQSWEKKEK